MPLLAPLDVIWIDDDTIRPPGPKMVICVEPKIGLFFRINTDPKWQTPIRIRQIDHPFLKWDSHIECGLPMELDDYVIEQSLRRRGVIGKIARRHVAAICAVVDEAKDLTPADKAAIKAALGG